MKTRFILRILGGLAVCGLALVPTAVMAPAAAVTDGGWSVESRYDASTNAWAIQFLLRSHGFALAVDGAFGSQTEDTVGSFQRRYSLPDDGVVGPQTWAVLVQSADQKADGVRAIQSRLNANGAGRCIDGDLGPATEQAMRDFQGRHGQEATGIASIETWEKLAHRLWDEEYLAGPQPC